MHTTRTIVFALAAALGAAACGSSAKGSAEPTAPARSVSTAAPANDGTPAAQAPPTDGPTLSPGAAAVAAQFIPLLEKFVAAIEPSAGHCDAMAEDIADFGRSDDGRAVRTLMADPDFGRRMDQHRDEIMAAYTRVGARVVVAVASCTESRAVREALDHAGFSRKVEVDTDGKPISHRDEASDDLPGER